MRTTIYTIAVMMTVLCGCGQRVGPETLSRVRKMEERMGIVDARLDAMNKCLADYMGGEEVREMRAKEREAMAECRDKAWRLDGLNEAKTLEELAGLELARSSGLFSDKQIADKVIELDQRRRAKKREIDLQRAAEELKVEEEIIAQAKARQPALEAAAAAARTRAAEARASLEDYQRTNRQPPDSP